VNGSLLQLHGRPRPVRWAIWLLLARTVADLLIALGRALAGAEGIPLIALGLGGVILLGLVLLIATGRRWAFVLYVLGFCGSVFTMATDPGTYIRQGLPVFIWYLLALALDVVGIVILLRPEARSWFAESKELRHRTPARSSGSA